MACFEATRHDAHTDTPAHANTQQTKNTQTQHTHTHTNTPARTHAHVHTNTHLHTKTILKSPVLCLPEIEHKSKVWIFGFVQLPKFVLGFLGTLDFLMLGLQTFWVHGGVWGLGWQGGKVGLGLHMSWA